MKKLTVLLLLQAIAFSCFSQKEITFETSTSFVNSTINDINLLIWENVKDGKLTAYRNDSLASTLTFDEIYEMSRIHVIIPVNPNNPQDTNDRIDTEVTIEFVPEIGFEGMSVSYESTFKDWQSSFEIRAFAPVWKPLTESGIELGLNPFFWVKKDDLIEVLSDKEKQLFEALILTREKIGDFANPWYHPYNNYEHLGDGIGYNAVFNQPYYHLFSALQDSIVGYHLSTVLTKLLYKADDKRQPLFKDVKCKEAFNYVQHDLMDSIVFEVPDPDYPDDPYALIEKEVMVMYDFDMTSEILVHGKRRKKVFEFRTENGKSVYIGLKELLAYANNHDVVLVTELIKK